MHDRREGWASVGDDALKGKVEQMIEDWPAVRLMVKQWADPETGFEAHTQREERVQAGVKVAMYIVSSVTVFMVALLVYIWQDRDKRLETQSQQIVEVATQVAKQNTVLERTLAVVERNVGDIRDMAARVERHVDNDRKHGVGSNGGGK